MKTKATLDKDLINKLRETHADFELVKMFKTSTRTLDIVCGSRKSNGIKKIFRRLPYKEPSEKVIKKKYKHPKMYTEVRQINTESWINDKRTAKHEVEIKEGFELVQIGMNPFYGFYDKKNNL